MLVTKDTIDSKQKENKVIIFDEINGISDDDERLSCNVFFSFVAPYK
jgi:hypothetical protein